MKTVPPVVLFVILISAAMWAQANPVPFVAQPLAPTSVAPGSGSFTLSVSGTGFVPGSTVNWNGATLPTTFVSQSQLTAAVPASNVAIPGTASVTVKSPAPGGGVSSAAFLQVLSPISTLAFSTTSSPAGLVPIFILTADFNGDGKLDVATMNQGGQPGGRRYYISVLLGNGDGSFQPPLDYKKGVGDGFMVAADFNGDGKIDLVSANDEDGSVSVLLGNGDGTFQNAQSYPAGFDPLELVAGDFNNDGNLDLVVGDLNSYQGTILLGNGDGTFKAPIQYDQPSNAVNLVVGDFDEDGNLDLAESDMRGDIYIFLGIGDGTFQSAQLYSAGDGTFGPVVADFNGDGHSDLAVLGFAGVSILLGNGDGTFRPPVGYATLDLSLCMTIGDFNADGKLDLAITTSYFAPYFTSVLMGNGDGTFQPRLDFEALNFPQFISMGDFDGNGSLDLVLPGAGNHSATVMQQTTAALSTQSLKYQGHEVGTKSDPKMVTLTNVGGTALNIASITVGGLNPRDFQQLNDCGLTLAPGATCTLTVTFRPRARETRVATISVTDDAPASPQTIALQGFGTPKP